MAGLTNLPRSSKDPDYTSLSDFPVVLDSQEGFLRGENNAITTLASGIKSSSTMAVLVDGSRFPLTWGVLRIDDEYAIYEERQQNHVFRLHRGFAGSDVVPHVGGAPVLGPCMADMHVSIRDALINIERKIGKRTDQADISDTATLRSRAAYLKNKWFTPRSLFYTQNRRGHAPLGVQFVDFSYGEPLRWAWEFGDGGVSMEQNPFHVYSSAGSFNVSLTVFTANNGVATRYKVGYIEALDESTLNKVMFYGQMVSADGSLLDRIVGNVPLKIRFVDQTRGTIESRIWSFGDGTTAVSEDTSENIVEHVYSRKGAYVPSLTVTSGDTSIRAELGMAVQAQ